jgi:hypothetical protein
MPYAERRSASFAASSVAATKACRIRYAFAGDVEGGAVIG